MSFQKTDRFSSLSYREIGSGFINKATLLSLFIVLFFLSAFRHESGVDFNNYRDIYEAVANGRDHWGATEPGFRMIIKALTFFSLSYQSFFIFS